MSRVKNFKHRDASLTEFQKQVCLGSLLGDSSLSRPKNGQNYHLSCYHAEAQLEWLEQKWNWLRPLTRPIHYCAYLDKRDGKTREGGRYHSVSAPCFTELANLFYQGGRKTITKDLINRLNHPVALACLICDDGHWDKAGIQIATKQFTQDENQIIAEGLSAIYGIKAGIHFSQYWSVRIPASDVETVRSVCLPYVLPSMRYKFGGEQYQTRLVGKVKITCLCGKSWMDYASNKRKYCSRECTTRYRPYGYDTRIQVVNCEICGKAFTPYHKKSTLCNECRTKTQVATFCEICGNPVQRKDRAACSKRCSVVLGHRHRQGRN